MGRGSVSEYIGVFYIYMTISIYLITRVMPMEWASDGNPE